MFYSFAKVVLNIFYAIFFRIRTKGLENFPKTGGAIACANHSSYHDSIVMAIRAPRVIRYMAKKELFEHKLLKPLIVWLHAFPVDRSGNNFAALKSSIKILKGGDIIGIFAQGGRKREGDDSSSAKGGVALMAIKAGVPVIPISIKSSFKFFSPIDIIYGEPISLSDFASKKLDAQTLKEATELIMDKINEQLKESI